ncbi:hypothetical protein UQ95_18570, partial [Shigella flexneri]
MGSKRLTDELIMESIATTICFIERHGPEHPADPILLTSLLRHIHEVKWSTKTGHRVRVFPVSI